MRTRPLDEFPPSNLIDTLRALHLEPLDLTDLGLNYHTMYGVLMRGRKPNLDLAFQIVNVLRSVAARRQRRGLPTIAPKQITIEYLFGPNEAPAEAEVCGEAKT
jgi:predicted transcriptional regulator